MQYTRQQSVRRVDCSVHLEEDKREYSTRFAFVDSITVLQYIRAHSVHLADCKDYIQQSLPIDTFSGR